VSSLLMLEMGMHAVVAVSVGGVATCTATN